MHGVLLGQNKIIPGNPHDTLPVKFDSLKAAIVTASIRPHMKGDTLEYNVGHMQMRSNAVIEELFRRLPGLHIDPDGAITYNGEKIQHLLIDGEDVFDDNPTLVTRHFDADKIAKVQILDRKSDPAQFTGMDDGKRIKTLNLVMKETAKNGYFGNLGTGGSAGKYYATEGSIAGFSGQEQLAGIALSSNTGSLGIRNGGTGAPEVAFLSNVSDPFGASAGTGIPQFTAAALHYSNRWNDPKEHLQVNYQFGNLWTHPMTSTQSIQKQTGNIFNQSQQSQSVNRQSQHAIHVVYDKALNSNMALHADIQDNISISKNRFEALVNSNFNDTSANNSVRTIQDHSNRQVFVGDVTLKVQVNKQSDRLFSLSTGMSKTENLADGYLYSVNHYFQPDGSVEQIDTIDQRKRISYHSRAFRGGITYTQPVFSAVVVGVRYAFSISNGHPEQGVYAQANGKYDQLVDSLTSNLKTQIFNQQTDVNLRGKTKHLNYTVGLTWNDYHFKQNNNTFDSSVTQHYIYLAPTAVVNYIPIPSFNIGFQYSVSAQQPTLAQLASIKNNSDPLRLTLGNPNLRPATTQSFLIDLRWLKAWMINTGINFLVINNSISTRLTTDTLGRQISQAVNVNGGRFANIRFSLNHRFVGVDWDVHTIDNYSRTVNFVNADLSRNDAYTTGGGIGARRYVTDKYSFELNTNFAYLYSKSSINSNAIHYWMQSHSGLASLYLMPKYEIGTDATYTWQEKTSAFSGSTSVLLWNAYVSRNVLQDKLGIKLIFNNILDKNSGITRVNSANTNTQTATNILGRYWMLSVSYHFDRKFKKKAN